MAYSSAVIPAAELALTALDKMMLIGRNWLRHTDATNTLRWTSGGTANAADESDTDGAAIRGGDDYSHLQTYPDTNQATWYYQISLDATNFTNAQREVDSLVILHHNLSTAGATVTLQIADNAAFSTNLIDLVAVTPTTDTRIVELALFDSGATALRYTGVAFARLKFTGLGAVPKIGEVVLGRRRQMKTNPLTPYDDYSYRSISRDARSAAGVLTRYSLASGQRTVAAQLSAHEDAYRDDLRALFGADTDYSRYPYWVIDTPTTAPTTTATWMHSDDPVIVGPLDGFVERKFSLEATEQGPHFLTTEL